MRRMLSWLPVFLAVLVGCTTDEPDRKAGPRFHSTERPNILLITLDTTRADRLGAYGYTAAGSAVMDALAQEGVRFEWAMSPTPLTLPSHASLFTGLPPHQHGLRLNFSGRLPNSAPTIAEMLQQTGYRTGAFISAFVLDARFGLERGFEVYRDDIPAGRNGHREIAEIPADVVVDRSIQWLREQEEDPFFCWVHFFDPHDPYLAPEPYASKFEDPYDGEIAFVDSQIGRLIGFLEESSLRSQTLILVAGDHGESLGEHGEMFHGFFIYNATMRVPLILSWPDHLPPGKVVHQPVGLIDIVPTLVEILDLNSPQPYPGRSLLELLGPQGPLERAVYSESTLPYVEYGWSPLFSVTSGRWKYIDSPEPELYHLLDDPSESVNLFDQNRIVADRLFQSLAGWKALAERSEGEELALDSGAVEKLRSLGYVSLAVPRQPRQAGIPEVLPTPLSMVEVFRSAQEGQRALRDRNYDLAVEWLQPLISSSPQSARIRFDLATAYFESQRYAESVVEYRAVLDLDPRNPDVHNRLGIALNQIGEVDRAVVHLREAVRLRSGFKEALLNLAAILPGLGRVNEALIRLRQIDQNDSAHEVAEREEFRQLRVKALSNVGAGLAAQGRVNEGVKILQEALRLEPASVEALNNLGVALLNSGKTQAAAEYFRRALEIRPHSLELRRNLALVLAAQGSHIEAIRYLKEIVRETPEDVEARNNLGVLLSDLGRLEEAGVHFSEAVRLRPKDADARTNLAIALARQGKLGEATAHLEEALRIDPTSEAARITLQRIRELLEEGR